MFIKEEPVIFPTQKHSLEHEHMLSWARSSCLDESLMHTYVGVSPQRISEPSHGKLLIVAVIEKQLLLLND